MGIKVIKDLVHGYIEIDDNLQNLIDTASFQRLRRVRQLSSSYIFPSVNHTRYEHSLGVMKLACDFFNKIKADFLKLKKTKKEIKFLNTHIRYAALLHDVGHPAFSHLGEKFLDKDKIFFEINSLFENDIDIQATFLDSDGKIVGKEHELMSCYCILKNFASILKSFDQDIDLEFICRMIIGNRYVKEDLWDRDVCIEILNSNSIDVDKLDYLMRDNHMTGEIAPKMDIKRLLSCLSIGEDHKLKYVAKAIPAIQSVVDSRDLLYLWVYHHHISVYTDYVMGEIILNAYNLYLNQKGKYPEELDIESFFSCKAIADNLIADDDVFSFLRKAYIFSKEGEAHPYTENLTKQIFERNFLKPIWKTIYEYKDFQDKLLNEKYIENLKELTDVLQDNLKIEEILESIRKDLNIEKGNIFIITKYNKFYNTTNDAPIYLYLNGENRKLSDLLPQKNFREFHEMSFFIFGEKEKLPQIKKEFLKILKRTKNK